MNGLSIVSIKPWIFESKNVHTSLKVCAYGDCFNKLGAWFSFCFLARKYGRIFFSCNFQFSILFFEMLRKLPQCYTHYSSSKNIFSLNDLTKNKLLGKKWDKLFFEHLKNLFSYSTFYSDSILVNIRIDFASK